MECFYLLPLPLSLNLVWFVLAGMFWHPLVWWYYPRLFHSQHNLMWPSVTIYGRFFPDTTFFAGSQKNLGPKIMGPKNWVQKNYWNKQILGPKNFRFKKIWSKYFWLKFLVKKIEGKKTLFKNHFGSNKNFGPTDFS